MIRNPCIAIGLVGLAVAWAPSSFAAAVLSAKDGTPVELSNVPKAALTAAKKELDAAPTSAKLTTFEGQPAYEVEGTNKYDKHLFVIVAPDGKIEVPVNIWEADDD